MPYLSKKKLFEYKSVLLGFDLLIKFILLILNDNEFALITNIINDKTFKTKKYNNNNRLEFSKKALSSISSLFKTEETLSLGQR
jgi:hypothetical protein